MNRRYFAISIIAISLILIAGLVYFFFFYSYAPPAEEPAAAPATGQLNQPAEKPAASAPVSAPANNGIAASAPKKTEMNEADLKRMAGSFAERFGSYSNQSDYANIEDLMIFMTPSMKKWAETFMSDAVKKNADRSIYYGITAKAVTEETKSYDPDAGTARILVKTQKREAIGTMANLKTFYQDIIIDFKKEGGAWKVDSAVWQS